MVLQNLRTLVSAPRLRPVVLRLMTALWKSQVESSCSSNVMLLWFTFIDLGCSVKDRVYPELQRLLALPDSSGLMGKEAHWEQSVAAAACLRDICTKR